MTKPEPKPPRITIDFRTPEELEVYERLRLYCFENRCSLKDAMLDGLAKLMKAKPKS